MRLLGRGVPGETFMSGATYSPMARQWAKDRGVYFYKGSSALILVGVLGAAYAGYKILG